VPVDFSSYDAVSSTVWMAGVVIEPLSIASFEHIIEINVIRAQ
jgi:hypothetical protein